MSHKITKEDYYQCDRCEINSLTKDRMCPCPRGSCEAEKAGTVITEVTIEPGRKYMSGGIGKPLRKISDVVKKLKKR